MPSVSCWRPNPLSSWYFSCKSVLRKAPKTHQSTTKYKYYYICNVLRLQLTHLLFCHSIQDTAILLNLIIILLMLSSTFVFQVGLVAILLERFRALLMLSALYLTFSVILHSWLVVPAACTDIFWSIFRRTKFYKRLGVLKTLFLDIVSRISGCLIPPNLFGPTVFRWCLCCKEQVKLKLDMTFSLSFIPCVKHACFVFAASVLYYYWYKRTSEYLGDPRLYEDSPWLREAYARVRQWHHLHFLLKLEGLCQMLISPHHVSLFRWSKSHRYSHLMPFLYFC